MTVARTSENRLQEAQRIAAAAHTLLAACKVAKKALEHDLIEPGRTAFWALVDAINEAEGKS